jgi:hypothetical protein
MTETPPKTTRSRVLDYLLQSGRSKLTPKQRRRVAHKSRRSLGRVVSGPIELDGRSIDQLAKEAENS